MITNDPGKLFQPYAPDDRLIDVPPVDEALSGTEGLKNFQTDDHRPPKCGRNVLLEATESY